MKTLLNTFSLFLGLFTVVTSQAQTREKTPSRQLVESALSKTYQLQSERSLQNIFRDNKESWNVAVAVNIDSAAQLPTLSEADLGFPGTGILRSEAEAIEFRLGEFKSVDHKVKAVIVLPADSNESIKKAARESVEAAIGLQEAGKIQISIHEGISKETVSWTWVTIVSAFLFTALMSILYYLKRAERLTREAREAELESIAQSKKKEEEPEDPSIKEAELNNIIKEILHAAKTASKISSSSLAKVCTNHPEFASAVNIIVEKASFSDMLECFPSANPAMWQNIQAQNNDNGQMNQSDDESIEDKIVHLRNLHKAFAVDLLANMPKESKEKSDSSSIGEKMSAEQIAGLLESLEAKEAAKLLVGLPKEKVQEACRDMSTDKLTKIFISLASMKDVARSDIQALELSVDKLLKNGSALGRIKIRTELVIPSLLSQLSAMEEQSTASKVLKQNPSLLRDWAQSRLYHEHIGFIDTGVLADGFSELELESQVSVWLSLSSDQQSRLKSHLSEKQLMMLSEGMQSQSNNKSLQAQHLRMFLDKIYSTHFSTHSGAGEGIFDFSALNTHQAA
ncbi:hypothetical protein GW916_02930 [bacterium]|nr:hypothetical protein [bacterium]